MDIALLNVIEAELYGVTVRVPHPACFALHKLLVAPRRTDRARGRRDTDIAIHVLELLSAQGEDLTVRHVFDKFPRPWRSTITKELARLDRNDLCSSLGLVK